jgi:hypothetical protein
MMAGFVLLHPTTKKQMLTRLQMLTAAHVFVICLGDPILGTL